MGGTMVHPSHYPCLSHSLFLLSLLAAAPTHHHPLPASKEGPPRSIQPEVAFSVKHAGPARHAREEPLEDDMEAKDVEDKMALSAEALDTMRKINPLTIANQVSQMFQNKADDKGNCQPHKQFRGLEDETPAHFAQPDQTDRDQEGARATGYVKNEAPTIIHKPRTNDFGYVKDEAPTIVHKPRTNDFGYVKDVAPTIVHKPRTNDFGYVKDEAPTIVHKPRPDDFGYMEVDSKGVPAMGDEPAPQRKEWRVPKPVDAQPVFPVYDEDISYIPDPFNGILDENYCRDLDKTPVDTGRAGVDVRDGQLWLDSQVRGVRHVEPHSHRLPAQLGDIN